MPGVTQAPERARTRVGMPQVRRDDGAWLPALLLALRTTAYGLIGVELTVLLLWATSPHSGAGTAETVRLGLSFWSAAQHATVHVGSGSLGIVPYALTLVPGYLLYRGARTLLAADAGMEPLAFIPALAVCYGVLCAAIALAARGPMVRPVPAEAFVGGAMLAVAAAAAAELRVHGRPDRLPAVVGDVGLAALRAVAVLLAAGLVLAAVVVFAARREVGAAAGALMPGVSGSIGLALLDLLGAGHLAVYGTSVLTGPGFGFGAHTSVSLAGSHLGAVPALPVLAALPSTGRFPAYALMLLVVPVAAGVLGGLRALRGVTEATERVRRAGATGLAGGALMAVVSWLADGSAGPGRLAVTGPSPWQVGLAAGGQLALGALLVVAASDGVGALRAWRSRR